MNKRWEKVLKKLFIICLCITTIVTLWILRRVDSRIMSSDFQHIYRKNHIETVTHPRNIIQVLANQNSLGNLTQMKLITTPNKTKMTEKADLVRNVSMQQGLKLEFFGVNAEGYLPCYEAHAFYYPWYGNPKFDGKYLHWNHPFLPHWNKKEAKKWPEGKHEPPEDVGASFYPLLGAYSSTDPDVVDKHMQMMRYARIGVVVVSWYPAGDADNEGLEPDSLMPLILDKAHKYDLKVAIHVEPFKNRNPVTMKDQLQYLLINYGSHPAFYITSHGDKTNLPLLYIYDSYLVDAHQWSKVFSKSGSMTIRDTTLDAIVIGLLVEAKHKIHILKSGFDGFYTYFGTNGFTFGSTWARWPEISKWAAQNRLLFIPSVGPGYIDTEVRPWNGENTRKRLHGKYYQQSFTSALNVKPDILSITSFNEWHEGTQIEPAVKKSTASRKYEDYGNEGPYFYLNITKNYVEKFSLMKL